MTFTHDEFSVTSDFDSSLCGDFTYTATFEGSSITNMSLPPVSYDSETRQFSVFYDDDINFIGLKTATVDGFYVLHSSNSFQISF